MARPLRIEYPGAFYHVISRGNEKKAIFRKKQDYDLFLETLKDACDYFSVLIHSYCLMPNHIHLLVETKQANLSRFMKRLLGVYTIRFNGRHKRHGHLFGGRYKAFLIDKDNYLLELSRYIHLNPVKAKLAGHPRDYPWSSMQYFFKGANPDFLYTDLILKEFSSKTDYQKFVRQGLREEQTPLNQAIGGVFLGSQEFVEKFKGRIQKKDLRKISRGRQLAKIPTDKLDYYLTGVDRNLRIYCYWKMARLTQPEIGKRFNVTDSAISHLIRRFEVKMQKDPKLTARIKSIEKNMSSFKN